MTDPKRPKDSHKRDDTSTQFRNPLLVIIPDGDHPDLAAYLRGFGHLDADCGLSEDEKLARALQMEELEHSKHTTALVPDFNHPRMLTADTSIHHGLLHTQRLRTSY